jgi:hypothetical protein
VSTTVFLGLVTHRASRFADSSGPDGLVATTASALEARGFASIVSISADDAFTDDLLTLDRAAVIASIKAELDTEERWRTYVSPGSSKVALRAFMSARTVYRRIRLAPPWQREITSTDAGARMLRRLINIELSHIGLMRQAVDCDSDWALIVEDDAAADVPEAFATALAQFTQDHMDDRQPRYVNVSRSFSEEHLGIDAHLTPVGAWGTAGDIEVLSAEQPVTNTVCAILYRTDFLRELLAVLDGIPVAPVLPIDWKLNEAILQMVTAGTLGAGDCWFLSPAPVVQRSMLADEAG